MICVSYGGGVNSTAMLVEMNRRGIRPDIILFADTGGERPETYQAIDIVSAWCISKGFPPIRVVSHSSKKHGDKSLEEECIRSKTLPSIAYGYKKCSQKWKIAPQDKFFNANEQAKEVWNKGLKIVKFIGYDAGEARRASIPEDDKYIYKYPLIDWWLFREDCVEICRSEGLPTYKSSCFFCPSMKRWEIFNLKEKHPALFQRAIEIEINANLDSIKGLGRNFSWNDIAYADGMQNKMLEPDAQSEIPCGCYDG